MNTNFPMQNVLNQIIFLQPQKAKNKRWFRGRRLKVTLSSKRDIASYVSNILHFMKCWSIFMSIFSNSRLMQQTLNSYHNLTINKIIFFNNEMKERSNVETVLHSDTREQVSEHKWLKDKHFSNFLAKCHKFRPGSEPWNR